MTYALDVRYVSTKDAVSLTALTFTPERAHPSGIGVLLVHGWTGKCTERHLVAIAKECASLGLPVVICNNRGAYKEGAAVEFFNDCLLDLQCAEALLLEQGVCKIVFAGHSYGALKASYYVHHQGKRAAGLVLMSSVPEMRVSSSLYEKAQGLLEGEAATHYFAKQEGEWLAWYHAHALIRHYEEAYSGTTLDLLRTVDVPILSLASAEEWDWFHEVSHGLEESSNEGRHIECQIVKGLGDHVYTGNEEKAADAVSKWIHQKILS